MTDINLRIKNLFNAEGPTFFPRRTAIYTQKPGLPEIEIPSPSVLAVLNGTNRVKQKNYGRHSRLFSTSSGSGSTTPTGFYAEHS